jgi:hypothetical protein
MHDWLVAITNNTVLVIDAMVLVLITIATIQAFVQGLRVILLPSATGHERRNQTVDHVQRRYGGPEIRYERPDSAIVPLPLGTATAAY